MKSLLIKSYSVVIGFASLHSLGKLKFCSFRLASIAWALTMKFDCTILQGRWLFAFFRECKLQPWVLMNRGSLWLRAVVFLKSFPYGTTRPSVRPYALQQYHNCCHCVLKICANRQDWRDVIRHIDMSVLQILPQRPQVNTNTTHTPQAV